MIRFVCPLLIVLMLVFSMPAKAQIPQDSSSAVIFVYQRVGEDQLPAANLGIDLFEEHLRELTAGNYNVMSIPDIIAKIRDGLELPAKTVGLSFDGAYKSTLENAVPLLEKYKFPFTIFVSTDTADQATPQDMSWNDLRRLQKRKYISLGVMPAAYAHMTTLSAKENEALMNKAVTRFREELGASPTLFAWPYGEFSTALKNIADKYSFAAAFGQQSGVVYSGSDFLALPRFLMTDDYGDIDRFRMTASANPLPVSDLVPTDTVLDANPPKIGFTVGPEVKNLSGLSCFASGAGKIPLEILGDNRVELRLNDPLIEERTRINCTLPVKDAGTGETLHWRWLGMLFVAPMETHEHSGAGENENTAPPAPDTAGSQTE